VDLADDRARRDLFDRVAASHADVVVVTEELLVYSEEARGRSLAGELRRRPSMQRWVLEAVAPVRCPHSSQSAACNLAFRTWMRITTSEQRSGSQSRSSSTGSLLCRALCAGPTPYDLEPPCRCRVEAHNQLGNRNRTIIRAATPTQAKRISRVPLGSCALPTSFCSRPCHRHAGCARLPLHVRARNASERPERGLSVPVISRAPLGSGGAVARDARSPERRLKSIPRLKPGGVSRPFRIWHRVSAPLSLPLPYWPIQWTN
jgi:hypothetical protein